MIKLSHLQILFLSRHSNHIYATLRSILSLPQIILFFLGYSYGKILKQFSASTKYCKLNTLIGTRDVQANLIFLKDLIGNTSQTLHIQTSPYITKPHGSTASNVTTKLQKCNYWTKSDLPYDYFFSGYVSIYFQVPLIFGILANYANNFIYIGSSGFFLSESRIFDYIILSILNKHIYSFFFGCDARHRFPSTIHSRLQNKTPICDFCTLKCRDSYNQLEASLHDTFCFKSFNSYDQQSYIKNSINADQFGYPIVSPKLLPTVPFKPLEILDEIKILHCASNPHYRGSQIITDVFAELNGKKIGEYTVSTQIVIREPRYYVLDAMKSSHIFVSALFFSCLGLGSIEAMWAYNIVISGLEPDMNPFLKPFPPVFSASSYHQLYDCIFKLCHLSREELISIMRQSHDYVAAKHITDSVREAWLDALSLSKP